MFNKRKRWSLLLSVFCFFGLLIPREGLSIAVNASSLGGHWSFDDAQGLVIPDNSGYGNHGKFIAWGIPIEKGKVREALHIFNGRIGYMAICPDASMTDVRIGYPECCPTPHLDGLSEFTVSAWVKFDQIEINSACEQPEEDWTPTLINRGKKGKYPQLWVCFGFNKENPELFGRIIANLGSKDDAFKKTISDKLEWEKDRWYHIAVAFSASKKRVLFYRDGISVGRGELSHDYHSGKGKIFIGVYQGGIISYGNPDGKIRGWIKHAQPMRGMLDEIRIHNQALNKRAIKKIVQEDLRKEARLASKFKLDDKKILKRLFPDLSFSEQAPNHFKDMEVDIVSCTHYSRDDSGETFIPNKKDYHDLIFISAPGEYIPASFVVRAKEDIQCLKIKASVLKNKDGGLISVAAIDIRVVKSWYQSGGAWYSSWQPGGEKYLVPELLLKNDKLIYVDTESGHNYVRVKENGKEKLVCVSKPFSSYGYPESIDPTKEMPVRDSIYLMPVNIKKGERRQFWVTIHIPKDASPGLYSGNIDLKRKSGEANSLKIMLKVLPFKLRNTGMIHGLAHMTEKIDIYGGNGSMYRKGRTPAQFKVEYRNMLAHGITDPTVRVSLKDEETLRQVLNIRDSFGLNNRPLYCFASPCFTGNPHDEEGLSKLRNEVRRSLAICREYGIPELYCYGIDEVKGDLLRSERPAWELVHQEGAKVWVCCFAGVFDIVKDILDIYSYIGRPNKTDAERWHSQGKQIVGFGNPQSAPENPEIHRRNYGLLLWKAGYDGSFLFSLYCGYANGWNDFDSQHYRDHMYTYPTMDGLIDTIAWEGYREGVNDIKYVKTLEKAIKTSSNSRIAQKARVFLENLDLYQDLDVLRLQVVDYILKLKEGV